ncbi:MAG: helix-turn-helix transcriptional regulator [Alphaproteobacteria bacterium]|nr:helix-turn-helix transcriptional regulator [Alphaproteobacteria bacterium]
MPPIEHVTVTVDGIEKKPQTFILSPRMGKEVADFISERTKEKSIPASDVLPELADDFLRPATMLRASRYKAGWTQKDLATTLDMKQHHVSEMENGKRPIGKAMAKRLAEVFECDYRIFV